MEEIVLPLVGSICLFLVFALVEELELGNASKWKENLAERTASRQTVNLMQLVYGKSTSVSAISVNNAWDNTVEESDDDEEFLKPKGEGKKVCLYLFWISFFFHCSSCCIYISFMSLRPNMKNSLYICKGMLIYGSFS